MMMKRIISVIVLAALPLFASAQKKGNECVLPVPGTETRSAEAGWKNNADWMAVAKDITATLEGKSLDILLLGDSITQGFGGNRSLVASQKGKEAMDEAFGEDTWESAGISGDRTQNLLWRIKTGEYEKCSPKYVVVTIGINNVLAGNAPKDIAEGVIACAEEVKKIMPEARVVMFGPLPAGLEADSQRRLACNAIHECLAKRKIKGVEYINPTAWFINADGSMKTELYSRDHLHLSKEGYSVWSKEIAEILK